MKDGDWTVWLWERKMMKKMYILQKMWTFLCKPCFPRASLLCVSTTEADDEWKIYIWMEILNGSCIFSIHNFMNIEYVFMFVSITVQKEWKINKRTEIGQTIDMTINGMDTFNGNGDGNSWGMEVTGLTETQSRFTKHVPLHIYSVRYEICVVNITSL